MSERWSTGVFLAQALLERMGRHRAVPVCLSEVCAGRRPGGLCLVLIRDRLGSALLPLAPAFLPGFSKGSSLYRLLTKKPDCCKATLLWFCLTL